MAGVRGMGSDRAAAAVAAAAEGSLVAQSLMASPSVLWARPAMKAAFPQGVATDHAAEEGSSLPTAVPAVYPMASSHWIGPVGADHRWVESCRAVGSSILPMLSNTRSLFRRFGCVKGSPSSICVLYTLTVTPYPIGLAPDPMLSN